MEKCVAVSHVRRFGKSQAAGMIDAYYSCGSDSKELFSKFEIAKDTEFEKHLNKYNVIHIDVSSVADFYKEGLVDAILNRLYDELKEEVVPKLNLNQAIQFLHSLFKSEESKSYLALAYITGILPIKKIRNESALNNFREYTMINSKGLAKYFGFTEDEVKILCKKYNMEFESITMAYFTAPEYYTIIRELPSGKGFVDFAFIPRKEANGRLAMIIELKWDESAETAIKQIKEKRYTGALTEYKNEILLVGISYNKNSEDKKHKCVIEKRN